MATTKGAISSLDNPKHMIIATENRTNGLIGVSTLLLKAKIEQTSGSKKIQIKQIQNGQKLLVITENKKQATELLKLKSVQVQTGEEIKLTVTESIKTNSVQGVVYCRDMIQETDDVIIKEINDSNRGLNAIAIKRLKKKNLQGEFYDTGTFFIQFHGKDLPQELNFAYLKIQMKEFVPPPLKCFKCHRFGHSSRFCSIKDENAICVNCSDLKHTALQERCNRQMKCISCGSNEHNNASRLCHVYKKEMEIKEIMIKKKCTPLQARQIHREGITSYAQAVNRKSVTIGTQTEEENTTKIANPNTTTNISEALLPRSSSEETLNEMDIDQEVDNRKRNAASPTELVNSTKRLKGGKNKSKNGKKR